MKCSESKELFTLFLNNELDKSKVYQLENHLGNCSACKNEFLALKKIWNLMSEVTVPEPSISMQADFNTVLRNFKTEQTHPGKFSLWMEKLREQWQLQLRPHFAISMIMIAFGFVLGFLLNKPDRTPVAYHQQIESLSSEVAEMKQVMMLTLLQDPSASQRIRAVSYTEDINEVSNKVIDALFSTLNGDPNVNVRLVTLEALVKYADNSKVREGLIQSLAKQESPLLQSAIADVMVKIQEKRSVKTMRKLLQEKGLNNRVKMKLEESIQKLI